MGYQISSYNNPFTVLQEKQRGALQALKASLCGTGTYSWASDSALKASRTLGQALEELGWDPSYRSDEDDTIIQLRFSREKLGDEDTWLKVIAPYVEAGSYIEVLGEERERWRWVFDGESMREVRARVIWDAEPEPEEQEAPDD